jgi:hypothetical protein
MISWSAENMTTGHLSAGVALTIANKPKVLDVLVAVGMLERKGGDYVIHDYCDYNPSGEQLAARRDELRTRRSDAGRQGALVRWGRGPSEGDSPSRRMANEAENHGKPDGNLPCTNMANDAPPDGRLLSASMANDRPQDGKTMPTLTSTSQIPPPTVVDYALAPVEPKAETRGGRKANARVTKHTPEQIAAKDGVMATFVECFHAKKQVEPKAILAADHAKAFELAVRFGADEACSIVRRAFEHDFVVRENATLRYIASRADTFRGTAPRKAHGRPEQQEVVGDEPWLREHLS